MARTRAERGGERRVLRDVCSLVRRLSQAEGVTAYKFMALYSYDLYSYGLYKINAYIVMAYTRHRKLWHI